MSNSFGQQASLLPALRGILRDYAGNQILKEMLQNADDAGAKRFYVCLDKRKNVHGKNTLLSPEMAEFQGPALYVYDDVEFKEIDYASIQRVGDGLKRGDPTKTGQFGLGFNSCYHLTDIPSFCSGSNLVLFDPHRLYLPADSRGERQTGMVVDMADKGAKYGKGGEHFADVYKDQAHAFAGMFGCTGRGGWTEDPQTGAPGGKGTLFRLPLRSAKVAKNSKIKRGTTAILPGAAQAEVIDPFIEDASSCMLFLRSVEEVKVYVWEDAADEKELMFSACMEDMKEEKRVQRKSQMALLKKMVDDAEVRLKTDRNYEWSDIEAENRAAAYFMVVRQLRAMPEANLPRPLFSFQIHSQWGRAQYLPEAIKRVLSRFPSCGSGCPALVEQYAISCGWGGHSDLDFVMEVLQGGSGMTLVPYAAVAARLAASLVYSDGAHPKAVPLELLPLEGKVFCCLPTPLKTHLPVHIDGRWELTRDRNYLSGVTAQSSHGKDGSTASDDAVRGEWNRRLANTIACPAYARLMSAILDPSFGSSLPPLTSSTITTMDYYSLYPLQARHVEPWAGMVTRFYQMVMMPSHPSWSLYPRKGKEQGPLQILRVLRPQDDVESAVRRALCFGSAVADAAHSLPSTLLYDPHNKWCDATEAVFVDEKEATADKHGSSSSSLWGHLRLVDDGPPKGPNPTRSALITSSFAQAPDQPVPSKKASILSRVNGLFRGSKESGEAEVRSLSGGIMSAQVLSPQPPIPPKPGITRSSEKGAVDESATESFFLLSLVVGGGASVTDAPPLLLEAIRRHFEHVRGCVSPASVRQLIGAGLMNLEELGTKDAASGKTIYHVDSVLPLLKYVTSDLATDDAMNKSGPPARELLGLPLLPLAAPSRGGDAANLVTMCHFSDYIGHRSRASPVLDVHRGADGCLQPSPGTRFLPRSHYAGAGEEQGGQGVATPVVPFALSCLLFPFKEALGLRMANLDTVVTELPAMWDPAGARVHKSGTNEISISHVCHVYPNLDRVSGDGAASVEADSGLIPLSVAHGLFLPPRIQPFLLCSSSEYDGSSNSGKVRGTSQRVVRHLLDKKAGAHTARHNLFVNMVFLDELWQYIEDLARCNPVNKEVWKYLLGMPLIPMFKGGSQWLAHAKIMHRNKLFVLDDPMEGCGVGGATGKDVDNDVVDCLEAVLVRTSSWIADASFLYRYAFGAPVIAETGPRKMASALPGCDSFNVKACTSRDVVDRLFQVHSDNVYRSEKDKLHKDPLILDCLSARERHGLMLYFSLSSNSYKPYHLYGICALPIFRRETGHEETPSTQEEDTRDLGMAFTSLLKPIRWSEAATLEKDDLSAMIKKAAEQWYTLPEFEEALGVTLDMSRFIARPPPSCMALYDKLQITSLPRHEFYCTWVLAPCVWRALTQEARMHMLQDIRANYEFMRQKPVYTTDSKGARVASTFHDVFRAMKLFWTTIDEQGLDSSETKWLAATELVDPRVALLSAFFPHRLPPEVLSGERGGLVRTRYVARDNPGSLDAERASFLPWLEAVGIASEVTPALLYDCAKRVSDDYLRWENTLRNYSTGGAMPQKMPTYVEEELKALLRSVQDSAKDVVKHFLEKHREIEDYFTRKSAQGRGAFENYQNFLAALGKLYIATVWQEPPQACRHLVHTTTPGGICTFEGSIMPTTMLTSSYCCSWSVKRVVRVFGVNSLPKDLVRGLGAAEEVSLEDVIQQLLFITSLPEALLVEWSNKASGALMYSRLGGEDDDDAPVSLSRSKYSREAFSETLTYVYHELGYFGNFTFPGASKEGGNTKNLDVITAALVDKPVVLVLKYAKAEGMTSAAQVPLFIRASQVFSDLESGIGGGSSDGDMAPYAYRLQSLHPALRGGDRELRILQSLGARNTPSLEQVQSWAHSMYTEHLRKNNNKHVPLNNEETKLALRLAHLCASICRGDTGEGRGKSSSSGSSSPVRRGLAEAMYIPDSDSILRKASAGLFQDDAPWLSGRIDKNRVPTIHSGLGADMATMIGVRKLSMAIREVPVMEGGRGHSQGDTIPRMLREAVFTWQGNLQSGAFQGSLRRAIHAANKKQLTESAVHGNMGPDEDLSPEALSLRIGSLAQARFVPLYNVQSRFYLALDGREEDVTLKAEGSLAVVNPVVPLLPSGKHTKKAPRPHGGPEGFALDPFTEDGRLVPEICLLVELQEADKLKTGWRRRLLAAIAIQLNKYLGFSLSERGLIPELLSADDSAEMSDILNSWQVPSVNLDLSLGSVTSLIYSGDSPLAGNAGKGDLTPCQPVEGEDKGGVVAGTIIFFRGDGGWCKGKVEAVLPGGGSVLAAISPEGVTRKFETASLLKVIKVAEGDKIDMTQLPGANGGGRRDMRWEGGDEGVSEQIEGTGDDTGSPPTATFDIRGISPKGQGKPAVLGETTSTPQSTWACVTCTFLNPVSAEKCEMCDSGAPQVGATSVVAVGEEEQSMDKSQPIDASDTSVYHPADADAWERQEEAILREMQEEDQRLEAVPLEREPAGIDHFMLEKPSDEALALYKSEDTTIAAVDKLIKSSNKDIAQIRTQTQVRPGYDLLRVGNYHEDASHPLPDIAFFHHRLTMDKVPQREALIRSTCLALRELCVTVFGYDARLVTLFFEEGAPSRFIRQKIMLNLAPIEKHYGANKGMEMYLSQPFTYTYIYGLLTHKLAHFFDIVHGSRHSFFMTEYRSLFMLQWIALLQSKGWDPEEVESQSYAQAHLYNVVI